MNKATRIALVLLAAAAAFACPAAADSRDPRPELVMHLLEYLRWPAESAPRNRISLCVDAGPAQFKQFGTLARTLKLTRPVDVRPLPAADEEFAQCRIVYTGSASGADILELAYRRGRHAIVLIGGDERAINFGADIALPIRNQTTALDINLGALKKRGIGISSRLLRLANIVYEE
jgi:hypothetical protein